MKKVIYIISISLALGGCASLTKTQVEAVNQFAQTTKDFSDFPSKIMNELAEIRVKRGVYFANSLSTPTLHLADLDSTFSQRNFDYSVSSKVDVTFKIIDKYSQSLLLLSSDKYVSDLEKQAKNFGVGIDSLIKLNNSIADAKKLPSGIGGAVGQLVTLGGKQYVKNKQAKEIKKFVGLADTLISVMSSNLLEYLTSTRIHELIEGEERGISSNYLSYLRQTQKSSIENDKEYLELKSSIDGVKKLQQKTIEATKNLRAAHKKLLKEITEKKKLKQTIEELQVLYEEINDLKETVEKIETQKK
jgi:hypothetical protein